MTGPRSLDSVRPGRQKKGVVKSVSSSSRRDVHGCTSAARGMEKVRPGTGREAGLGHAGSGHAGIQPPCRLGRS